MQHGEAHVIPTHQAAALPTVPTVRRCALRVKRYQSGHLFGTRVVPAAAHRLEKRAWRTAMQGVSDDKEAMTMMTEGLAPARPPSRRKCSLCRTASTRGPRGGSRRPRRGRGSGAGRHLKDQLERRALASCVRASMVPVRTRGAVRRGCRGGS